MKIGIVTFWTSTDNYGQLLQHYALQSYLNGLGHDAFLIRYSDNTKQSILSKIKALFLSCVKYIIPQEKKHRIEKTEYERKLRATNLELNKQRAFREFMAEYFSMSEGYYDSIDSIRANPPQADIYICGSDQIWGRPLNNMHTAGYYLNFGDENIKRISYAASMGGYVPSGDEIATFRSFLDSFNSISLREESSVEFCRELGYANAKVTLDPTLLLPSEKYIDLCNKESIDSSKRFMFMYILNIKSKEEMYWREVEQFMVNQSLDLKIVYSSGYMQARELVPECQSLQATIPQWLLCIKDSEYVITTSFHCVVFSIKFHKQFLAILLDGAHSKGNVRITSLLEKLGLSSRVFDPHVSVDKQMLAPINWEDVEERLPHLQIESLEFLNQHLSE